MLRRLLLVAVIGVVGACGSDGEETTTTPLATATSIAPVTTEDPASSTTLETTSTLPPTLAEAPVFDRWTTILESLPTDEWDEAAATDEAFSLIEHGAGLLLSSDYPSLNPGYWVVFSGDFETQEEALAHCRTLHEADVPCYHRFLGEAPVVIAGRAEGTLVAWVDSVLSVVDAESGTVVKAVSDFYQGGVFPGSLELSPDGTGAYFSMGFEDYWYSCEASAGRIDFVNFTTGEATTIAAGFSPKLSPDGTRLVYVAATHCVPDPENDLEVISYADAIAVLDLVTGRVQTWGPSPGMTETAGSFVASVAWGSDGVTVYVAMDDGTLRVVDTGVGSALDAAPTLGPGRDSVAFGAWSLEGVDGATGNLVGIEIDYGAATSRIIEISLQTGLVVDAGPARSGFWTVRLDAEGTGPLLSGSGIVTGAPAGDLGPEPMFSGADW